MAQSNGLVAPFDRKRDVIAMLTTFKSIVLKVVDGLEEQQGDGALPAEEETGFCTEDCTDEQGHACGSGEKTNEFITGMNKGQPFLQ
mmetsp:Transcript_20708/g.56882  ORF Transcript_20708/g.56882 Transcript_20708/m.56882 type:complete len:87 (+) Transcript_20708:890-1150(+)|eukprot:scaffold163224_cov34-Tisochrysis_lutea.AAC.2